MNRAELIQRKGEVQARIGQARRRLALMRSKNPSSRSVEQLESALQALMAEEYRLRLLIDRSR